MKKKLKLNELQVKSFVTTLDNKEKGGLYGASGQSCPNCPTPVVTSRDRDCVFTRFDNVCIVAVSGGIIC